MKAERRFVIVSTGIHPQGSTIIFQIGCADNRLGSRSSRVNAGNNTPISTAIIRLLQQLYQRETCFTVILHKAAPSL